jgi:hybrid cluster-associated redox disulfide protein
MIDINSETSVSELVREHPLVIPIFLKHQMACVGCSMSAFETLAEAARVYNIPAEEFIHSIHEIIGSNQ